jgi:hypothetical protein
MSQTTHRMRIMAVLACAVFCASTALAKGPVASAPIGHWTGTGRIVANWTVSKDLPFDIHVAADGTVTGSIGDATIASGSISFNQGIKRAFVHSDFTVAVTLTGPLLAKDGVTRKRFDLHLTPEDGGMSAFGASNGHDSWPLASRASRVQGAKIQVAKFDLRQE